MAKAPNDLSNVFTALQGAHAVADLPFGYSVTYFCDNTRDLKSHP